MDATIKVNLEFFVAAIICCGMAAFSCVAADYPVRPVRFIVPAGPGSGPDITSRLMAAEFTKHLGNQFIVDNRPGASGVIGTEMIVRAVPDGYTIGQGNFQTLATNRSLLPDIPYDPERDIQAVGRWGLSPNILAVSLSLPVKSVQELIEHARKNPGKLMFASGGNGSSMRLSMELLKRMTGTDMVHVPFKSIQQGISDMIAGQIHIVFDNASSISPHVRAGRVRGLAVSTIARVAAYPELPTVAESGVPGFEVVVFGGIIAPAGVSRAIVNRLNAEINRAVAKSPFSEKYSELGSIPIGGTPEEFTALIKKEVAKWAAIIKGANIKAD